MTIFSNYRLETTRRPTTSIVLLLLVLLVCPYRSAAWVTPPAPTTSAKKQPHFHHILPIIYRKAIRLHDTRTTTTSNTSSTTTHIVQLSCDEPSIQQASRFMVESFWLGNERVQLGRRRQQQQQQPSSGGDTVLSESDIGRLVQQQEIDFTATYGEIMGTRLLDAAILAAVEHTDSSSSQQQQQHNTNVMIGMVALQVCILDHATQTILNAETSEGLLKNAVASLGSKQRRYYKNCSAQQIAAELLWPKQQQQLVCCLCNLSVAPTARRRGIATWLCQEAEALAQAAGFAEVYLAVEVDNAPARVLYEQKLGYNEIVYLQKAAPAMRIDLDIGQFVSTRADTLILKKKMV